MAERWGDTHAYRESARRTSGYSKADWQRMKAEVDEHNSRLVEAFAVGHAPDSVEAMDLVEEHRQHITRWFYDCPPAMHRALGEMYVTDPRFTKTFEDMTEGLAHWVTEAFAAYAARREE